MAHPVFNADLGSQRWTASGPINLQLSYQPMTITRLAIVVRAVISTGGSAGTYNDPLDRIINSLSVGQGSDPESQYIAVGAAAGVTGGGLRLLQHGTRYWGPSARRPNAPGNNATNVTVEFAYLLHLGAQPRSIGLDGTVRDNPFDLTGGIPITPSASPSVLGTYDAAGVEGTGWTVSDGRFSVYAWGVEPEAGDDPSLWMPRAYPRWYHHYPTPSTSVQTAFSQVETPDAGDLLHSVTVMSTYGASASDNSKPRSDQLLNSLQLSSRWMGGAFWTVGGVSLADSFANGVHTLTGISATAAEQYKAAEALSQLGDYNGWPPSEDPIYGTLGAATVAPICDAGLVYLPIYRLINNTDAKNTATTRVPLVAPWGLDNRVGNTLSIRYGLANVYTPSGGAQPQTLDFLYRGYRLNPDHPLNASL